MIEVSVYITCGFQGSVKKNTDILNMNPPEWIIYDSTHGGDRIYRHTCTAKIIRKEHAHKVPCEKTRKL